MDPIQFDKTVQTARQLTQKQEYGAALKLYMAMLQQSCAILDTLAVEIISLTEQFVQLLLKDGGNLLQATWLWTKIVELSNRRNSDILRAASRYFIKIGNKMEAMKLLLNCINLDKTNITALDTLENLKCQVVDRWHFRMVNDCVRNAAYKNAIYNAIAIKPNGVVLDIGGGSGILSIYAAKAGASKVYCCEMSEELAAVARQCIADNGVSHIVTVLTKHSRDLQIPRDITERVDIIVTELVDSGLLGEHIMETLATARRNLLIENGGVVIPHSAKVWGQLISSEEIRHRSGLSPLSSPTGLVLSQLQLDGITIVPDEQYTCEDLLSLPHEKLSDPVLFQHVNFNVPDNSRAQLTSFTGIGSGHLDAFVYWFDLCLEDPAAGIDDDNAQDQSCVVSTAPGRPHCGWDQAVLFTHKFSCQVIADKASYVVKSSYDMDKLNIDVLESHVAGSVNHLSKTTADEDEDSHMSQENSLQCVRLGEVDIALLNNHALSDLYLRAISLYQEMLLNNNNNNNNINTSRKSCSSDGLRMIELCGPWQSTLLTHCCVLKLLLDCNRGIQSCDIFTASLEISDFLEKLANSCDIYVNSRDTRNWRECPREFLGVSLHSTSPLVMISDDSLSKDMSSLFGNCDLLVCDLIDSSGVFRQESLKELMLANMLRMSGLKRALSSSSAANVAAPDNMSEHDSDDCEDDSDDHDSAASEESKLDNDETEGLQLCVPDSVTVVVCLVECATLLDHHLVHPDRTANVCDPASVHAQLNLFGASQLRELDLRHMRDVRFLSAPLEAMNFRCCNIISCDTMTSDIASRAGLAVAATCSGVCHAVAVWYSVQLLSDEVLQDMQCAASAYTFNTGPIVPPDEQMNHQNVASSSSSSTSAYAAPAVPANQQHSHWRQAAVLLEAPRAVQPGQAVAVTVTLNATVGVLCTVET